MERALRIGWRPGLYPTEAGIDPLSCLPIVASGPRRETKQEWETARMCLAHFCGSSIEFSDVHFTYENAVIPALRNVDLIIKRGERLGIAGQTGSGKSTILDLVLGLLSPTSGEVLIDGSHHLKSA